MLLQIALVNLEGTTNIKEIDLVNCSMKSKRIDTVTLADETLSLTLYPDSEEGNLANYIDKEKKFYPIFSLESLNIDITELDSLTYEELKKVYDKVSARWILNNNLQTIEQLAPTIRYLKDLWIKDRNTFFEELWFLIRSNISSTELNIIFHDLKEPTDKQAEKGEKPKLIYSYVQGQKVPHLFEGKDKENVLMKEYENEFTEIFSIIEYSSEKGQLTACGKIDLSPILMLAKIPSLNQIQQSLLIGIFNGLQ